MKKNPSDFTNYPWSSVTGNAESEIVALNIITILARNGNKWRALPFEEYRTERLKDGNYTSKEEDIFNRVLKYTTSKESAESFSKEWR